MFFFVYFSIESSFEYDANFGVQIDESSFPFAVEVSDRVRDENETPDNDRFQFGKENLLNYRLAMSFVQK